MKRKALGMSGHAAKRWFKFCIDLHVATTILVAAICLRVAFGPTPESWGIVIGPMLLLTTLTVSLTQQTSQAATLHLHWVAVAYCGYILSVLAISGLSQWHWSDQILLAAFCAITVLVGDKLTSNESLTNA